MRKREDILKELEEVKAEAARGAQFGNAPQLAMQAGINAPLMSTALGSLLEVALDIRDLVKGLAVATGGNGVVLGAINSHAVEQRDLLGEIFDLVRLSGPPPDKFVAGEDIPVIEPGNVVNTDHLRKIFPPCPACGSENVNGSLTDETGRSRKCETCGHEWELKETEEAVEREQVCNKCGTVLDEYTNGLFCPKCDEQRGRKKVRRGNS